MVVHRRKKVTKYRGHVTHGGGSRKKRRGAGSRGGRGNAGTGKRAGHKKFSVGNILGREGFVPRRTVVKVKAINLSYFTSERLDQLVASGKAEKEGKLIVIDLNKLGYNKLLGTGRVPAHLKFIVSQSSAQAAKKVKEAGGEVSAEAAAEKQESK